MYVYIYICAYTYIHISIFIYTKREGDLNGLDLGDSADAAEQLLEGLARHQLHRHPEHLPSNA